MKKIVSNLMLAGLFTIGLAACNSGGGATPSNSSTNTVSANTNQSNINNAGITSKADFGSTGTIINMLGGDIIHAFINPVTGATDLGTQLLGLLTGEIFPTSPTPDELQELEAQNAQMFSSIQSNLNTIETTLANQGQLLQTIYQHILNQALENSTVTFNEIQSSLPTAINAFNSILQKNGATQLPSLLSVSNNQTLTLSQNDLSALLAKTSITAFQNNFNLLANTTLDGLEQTVAGDNGNQYSVESPTLHGPFPTEGNLLFQNLSNAYNDYTAQVNGNFQNGVFNGNLFQSQATWNNTVDATILGMVTTLNAAYRIDQVKLYLYYNTNKAVAAPSVIYTPDLDNGYQAALADLTYAYNQRLANLAAIDNQYKTMFWNQYFGVLGTNLSGSNTCNLNNTYLSSLQNPASMGSWNGTNLTISCNGVPFNSNSQNPQLVNNQDFTPSVACSPNANGVYSDLTLTKAGYIICGTNDQDWNLMPAWSATAPSGINQALENANNGVYAQANDLSQYSVSYIYTPLPTWTDGLMPVILPNFNNGTMGFLELGPSWSSDSGIWKNTPQNPELAFVEHTASTNFLTGTSDGATPINNFIGSLEAGHGVPSVPLIYYDNYHALVMNAVCSTGNIDGRPNGCGIALACVPGLSDCIGSSGGSTEPVGNMNLSTARNWDSIQFANGDKLTMQVSNVGQPYNAGTATIQYATNQ